MRSKSIQGEVRLLESRQEGKLWRVLLVEAGLSGNGVFYPAQVLKKAAKLFENAKAYAYEFKGKHFDHLPDEVEEMARKGLAKNLVGYFSNIKFEDEVDVQGEKKQGLTASLYIDKAARWLRDKLVDTWQRGLKQYLGLSINVSAQVYDQIMDNRKIPVCATIDDVHSVEVVTHPAAGGRMLRLVASMSGKDLTEKEFEKMGWIEKLIEVIKASRPELLEGYDLENLEESQAIEILTKVLEAKKDTETKGAQEKDDAGQTKDLKEQIGSGGLLAAVLSLLKAKKIDEAMQVIQDALGTKTYPYPQPQKGPEEEGKKEKKDEEEEAKKASKEVEKLKNRLQELEKGRATAVLESLLSESELPDLVKEKIRKQFEGKLFDKKDVEEAIKAEKELLAKLTESGEIKGLGFARVSVGEEPPDRFKKAMDGLFDGQDVDKVPRFRSLTEAARNILGDDQPHVILKASLGFDSAPKSRRLKESMTTASWAQILGDSITRKMLKEYSIPALNDWRKVVSDISGVKDFRTNRRMRMGGYGVLSTVAEQGTYPNLTSPTDEEATYAISKKGGLEDLTMEMVANDDVAAIKRIPVRLGRAAARTLYKAIFDIFVNNAAVTYDGVVLFHSTHGNTGTTALSEAEMLVAVQGMRNQAAYGDSYEILSLKPKFLLVPNELEKLGYQLINSLVSVAATDSTIPNLIREYGLELIVVDYWTDATDWFLVADPANCPTIEVGFYQGKEEPELFVQDQPNVGSVFTADKITYKIRHIWGYSVLDHRGMWGEIVA